MLFLTNNSANFSYKITPPYLASTIADTTEL
nr:MAG TPA: hypothetical protein [Caudoviricetes sp.]